jgi:hypothetical protein
LTRTRCRECERSPKDDVKLKNFKSMMYMEIQNEIEKMNLIEDRRGYLSKFSEQQQK